MTFVCTKYVAHTTMAFILITIMLILSPLLISNTQDEKAISEGQGSHEGDQHLNIAPSLSTPPPSPPPRPPASASYVINASVISGLYKKVMEKYDKKFRPDFEENATAVGLEFHVLSFANPDEGAMEYGVDFYFAQIWYDRRFVVYKPAHPKAIINLVGKEVDDLWLPDTVFVNSKSSKFHTVTVNNRFLSVNLSNGMIIYHSRITTTASCRLNLRDYPFDEQRCYLAIESYGHDTTDILFYWFDTRTGKECQQDYCMHIHVYDKELSNFDLLSAKKSKNKTAYHAPAFSSATTIFSFRRRCNYFVFQVYIPSSLIVMVAWTSFWMTPTAVPARSAICVTTVLTLITMLGIVNANMPRVSYIKALDLYLLVSFLFVFAALFEFILVLNVTNECIVGYVRRLCRRKSRSEGKGNYEEMTLEEKTAMTDTNSHAKMSREKIIYATKSCYGECCPNGISARRKAKQQTVDIPSSQVTTIAEKKPVGPSSSVIDICARVIFPVLYASFNVAYWVKYVGGRLQPHKH